MSSRHLFFRIQFQNFNGNAVVRFWRMNSLAAARTKAVNDGNCCKLVSVTEITEVEYEAGAKGQRSQHQFLRVSNRPEPKRKRRRAAK